MPERLRPTFLVTEAREVRASTTTDKLMTELSKFIDMNDALGKLAQIQKMILAMHNARGRV